MLLVIDIGNTNTVLGIYEGEKLVHHWRLETSRNRTSDEYGVLIRQLFAMAPQEIHRIEGAIVACVVPPMLSTITAMVETFFGLQALVVGPGIKTGMPILYENPREVGADRIVNAVAAFESYGGPCIVCDFGKFYLHTHFSLPSGVHALIVDMDMVQIRPVRTPKLTKLEYRGGKHVEFFEQVFGTQVDNPRSHGKITT
jgi:pantothenate kinase type III